MTEYNGLEPNIQEMNIAIDKLEASLKKPKTHEKLSPDQIKCKRRLLRAVMDIALDDIIIKNQGVDYLNSIRPELDEIKRLKMIKGKIPFAKLQKPYYDKLANDASHFCKTMLGFCRTLEEYHEKAGLAITFRQGQLCYDIDDIFESEDEQKIFEQRLEIVLIKAIKSKNTLSYIERWNHSHKCISQERTDEMAVSLAIEKRCSEQTMQEARQAIPKIDELVSCYFREQLTYNAIPWSKT